ncbi:hypothetical protein CDD83_7148 [Cordyceps sp. RAO-2017]|nr:hypothetical protein CDD83_7148 [Cordyceps sp. RAO-2017]
MYRSTGRYEGGTGEETTPSCRRAPHPIRYGGKSLEAVPDTGGGRAGREKQAAEEARSGRENTMYGPGTRVRPRTGSHKYTDRASEPAAVATHQSRSAEARIGRTGHSARKKGEHGRPLARRLRGRGHRPEAGGKPPLPTRIQTSRAIGLADRGKGLARQQTTARPSVQAAVGAQRWTYVGWRPAWPRTRSP